MFAKDSVSWVFEDLREYRLGLGPSQFKQNTWSAAEDVETRMVTREVVGHPAAPSGFLFGFPPPLPGVNSSPNSGPDPRLD